MQQQSNQRQPLQEMRDNANLLIFCAQAVASMPSTALHRPGTAGERAHGLRKIFGFLFMWLFAPLCFPGEPAGPMLVFAAATTGLLLLDRLCYALGLGDGPWEHSSYTGRPWFDFLGDEITVKLFWEPAAVLGCGLAIRSFDAALGAYLIVAGIALSVDMRFQSMWRQSRRRAIRDARIEQEQLMAEMRDG